MVDHTDLLAAASSDDVQATFCATLVDEWLYRGVRHAVIAPGSRSTPMALAIAARDEFQVHVVHDERVAAFVALGLGVASVERGEALPALLLCTSGTAAANFLPAVVEAGLSEIPMLVLTADRPEELRGVGAPQTIDQIELFGSHVRWFHDPDVPEAATAGEWRGLGEQSCARSANGPVHLNLPFREPLVGTPLALPNRARPNSDQVGSVVTTEPDLVTSNPVEAYDGGVERGVILVGGRSGVEADRVLELRARTSWPIIADAQSGMRHQSDVTAIDALLRVPGLADDLLPDVIVRVGRPSASKVLGQWSARAEPMLIQVGGPGVIDPSHTVAAVCGIDELIEVSAQDRGSGGTAWLDEWKRLETIATTAIDGAVAIAGEDPLTEPAVSRVLAAHAQHGAQLTVSSSMPVRDMEWFGGRTPLVHANRGANGIDGVTSTALGRALFDDRESVPAYVLIGDLAFVHDSNALVSLVQRGVDLRIVVVDNDGGAIFSFLPQRTQLEHERFEQLFGTPLGSDVLALAGAHGLATAEASTAAELRAQLSQPGPWVCRVRSNRDANVRAHEQIHAAVQAAVAVD